MSIKNISNEMWPEILRLETEAYFDIEPESLETLRSKWLVSPEFCFVYEVDEKITGFILAHPWGSLEPPKLFEPLTKNMHGQYLFIHDLVIKKKFSGMGVGRKMVSHLLQASNSHGFDKVLLVSVQDSQVFWSKFEFDVIKGQEVDSNYGINAVIMQR